MRDKVEADAISSEPKAATLPTDFERLLWNVPLYLAIAFLSAALLRCL